MPEQAPRHDPTAKAGRRLALVVAGGGILAVIAPWLTEVLNLPARYEFLFYLISLAAFFWALVVAVQIWQKRK